LVGQALFSFNSKFFEVFSKMEVRFTHQDNDFNCTCRTEKQINETKWCLLVNF